MLIAQWGPVALGTSEKPVADNQLAADGAELLLYGILDDNVTARRVAVADRPA